MTFVALLNRELDRKRWSQSDLARALKTGRSTVNRWFKGGECPPKQVRRIAAALGIDPLPLLAAQGDPTAPAADFLSAEAQVLAKRWQSLPPEDRDHVRWLIETVGALRNHKLKAWEDAQPTRRPKAKA